MGMTTTVTTTTPSWWTGKGWPTAPAGYAGPIGLNIDGSWIFPAFETDSSAADWSTIGAGAPAQYSSVDPTTLTPDTSYSYADSLTSFSLSLTGGVLSGVSPGASIPTCAGVGVGYIITGTANGQTGAGGRSLAVILTAYAAPCTSGGGYGVIAWGGGSAPSTPGAVEVFASVDVSETGAATSPLSLTGTWPSMLVSSDGSVVASNPMVGSFTITS